MRRALVVMCEPGVEAWLVDDGGRLMPMDMDEWVGYHAAFVEVLQEEDVGFVVVGKEIISIYERLQFVLKKYEEMSTDLDGSERI